MVAERLEFNLQVTGQPQATREVQRFQGAVGNLSQSTSAAAGHFSGLAGVVGNVGTAVAATSPQMAAFGGVIGNAGSAVSALTTSLGGVGGIIGGGLIAAVGVLAVEMATAKSEAQELKEEFEKLESTAKQSEELMRLQFPQTLDEFRRAIRFTTTEVEKLEKEVSDLGKVGFFEGSFQKSLLGDLLARNRLEEKRTKELELQAAKNRLNSQIQLDILKTNVRNREEEAERLKQEEARAFARERSASAARAEALADTERFRVTGESRTGALAELEAFGFVGADPGTADPDASVFGGAPREGFVGELTQTGFQVGRKRKFDVEFTDRATAAIEAEERIQSAIMKTAEVRSEANATALSGAQQFLSTVIIGNDKEFEAQKRNAEIAVQRARANKVRSDIEQQSAEDRFKANEDLLNAVDKLNLIEQQSARNRAKAALRATGDALVAQGVSHGFEAVAMAVMPGLQGNAAVLAGIAAAEIAAGKAMGAIFEAPATTSARPVAAPVSQSDSGTFVQINMDPVTGERVVKTLRDEKKMRGPNAVKI